MSMTIGQIIEEVDGIAPPSLAERGDNVGLHVGHRDWPVRRIWVALEASHQVVGEAARSGLDLIITHHPLIYKPLVRMNPEDEPGRTIALALEKKIGIFCAHTNLDSSLEGLNDMLADRIGLKNRSALRPAVKRQFKLVVFVPKDHETEIMNALFKAGAGYGRKYQRVSFRTQGIGTFEAGPDAAPFLGSPNDFTETPEYRVEVCIDGKDLPQIFAALEEIHPYEEAVFDLYEIGDRPSGEGLGRIGWLNEKVTLRVLAKRVKEILKLQHICIAGDPELLVEKIALCTGSGRSLMGDFFRSGAQVYISGELGYHDGRAVEAAGKGLIVVGHFASEHIVAERLAGLLKKTFDRKNCNVRVEAYEGEKDCFHFL